jgi:hypothetical protein
VESVAAESEESKVERASCAGKLEILEKALSVLRRLDRHNPRKIKRVNREAPGSAVEEECAAADDSGAESEL